MNCPKCNSYNQTVVDSRSDEMTVKRRRKCFDCGYRFSTLEIAADRHADLLAKEQNYNRMIAVLNSIITL